MRRKKSTGYRVLVQASRSRCFSISYTRTERGKAERERERFVGLKIGRRRNSFSRRLSREMGSDE